MKNLFLLFVLLLAGCSTAGPYVTQIQRDPNGSGFLVTRCYTRYKTGLFVNRIGTAQCTTAPMATAAPQS